MGLLVRRRREFTAIGVVAVAVAATLALVGQYAWMADGYIADDAFISFRYAANLADGLGPVWNAGERVEGYTNFGWVLLLALGQKLGVDPLNASRALGISASAATFALIPFLAAQLRPVWSRRWWLLAIGASIALALNSGFSLWTFAGLETTAFAFLVTAGAGLHLWEERKEVRPLWSAAVFLAAALMRPEGVLVWAVTALFKLPRLFSGDRQARLAELALWAALFLVPYGGYWLWRWNYYGYFFPNSYYLKTARTPAIFERGLRYAWHFFAIYSVWLMFGALVSTWRERQTSHRPAAYLVALLAVWFAYVIYTGGDWMPYFRFFVPLLPIVYLLMMHGAIELVDLVQSRVPYVPLIAGATVVITALIGFSAIRPYDNSIARQGVSLGSHLPGGVHYANDKAIGLWMRDNLPADYTVAEIPAGIVPYFSGLRTIDMLGVNDEHIAHLSKRLGSGPSGHEKEDGAYVVSREPEIIWLAITLEREPRYSVDDYLPPKDTDWVPVKASVTRSLYTWSLYRPVAIPLRDGWLNLIVHNRVDLPALGITRQ